LGWLFKRGSRDPVGVQISLKGVSFKQINNVLVWAVKPVKGLKLDFVKQRVNTSKKKNRVA